MTLVTGCQPSPDAAVTAQRDVRPAWVVTYDGPRHKNDAAADIVLSPDGATAFVSGTNHSNRCVDFSTIAYDTTDGSKRWVALYESLARWCGSGGVAGLALSPDAGTLFVAASSYGRSGEDSDITTIAYDTADGSKLWEAREEGPISGQDDAVDVVAVGDAVYVTGNVTTRCVARLDTCYVAIATAAYDATTGNREWFVVHHGDAASSFGTEMVAAPNGGVIYVAGVSVPSHELETVAYDPASGVERWTAHSSHIHGSSFPRHSQIDVSRDGAWVFVSGTTGDRYRLVAYASDTGAEVWTTANRLNIGDVARLAASPSADVLFFTAENRRDYLTAAIDARTGGTLWRSRYDGAGYDDIPKSIAVSDDGSRVYVTGESGRRDCEYCPSFATLAFDAADGEVLWTDRYGGDAFTYGGPGRIVASGDGDSYIVGSIETDETWDDFVTLKYEPPDAVMRRNPSTEEPFRS